jgi:hypothetical protein
MCDIRCKCDCGCGKDDDNMSGDPLQCDDCDHGIHYNEKTGKYVDYEGADHTS